MNLLCPGRTVGRQKAKNFCLLTFNFLLLTGLLGCGNLVESGFNGIKLRLGVNFTNIAEINPQRDINSTVYLQGKVVKQVPLLKRRVYQLQDSTGTIWVLTNQTRLQQGDKVLVKGKVRYQSIPLAGKNFGEVYVEEQEQMERTRAQ